MAKRKSVTFDGRTDDRQKYISVFVDNGRDPANVMSAVANPALRKEKENEVALMENKLSTSVRSIPEITADIKANVKTAAVSLITIGLDLIEAKGQMDHGAWTPWLKTLNFSPRTAENYMRIAAESAVNPALTTMPYTKAVAFLSAPAELQEQLLEQGIEDKSAAEIKRLTKELKEAQQSKQTMERQRDQFMQQAADNSRELYAEKEKSGKYAREAHDLQLKLQEQLAKPPIKETVEVVKEVIPDDYETLKVQMANAKAAIKEAQDAADDAERRLEQALSSHEDDDDEDDDSNPLANLMSTCTDLQAKMWSLPFVDFAEVSPEKRRAYRIAVSGVASLCTRILQAIDAGDGIIVDEGGAVV